MFQLIQEYEPNFFSYFGSMVSETKQGTYFFLFRLFRVFGSRLTMPTWDHIQLRQTGIAYSWCTSIRVTNCWYTPVLYTPLHCKMKQTHEWLHQHIYRVTTLVWQLLPSNWSGLRCISFQIHEKTSMNPWYIHLIFIKANLEFHLLLQ